MKATSPRAEFAGALVPVLATATLLLGVTAGILFTKAKSISTQVSELQAENMELRQQLELASKEREMLTVRSGEVERLRKDVAEVHKLRAEVVKFRELQPEFQKLQQQATLLQGQLEQQKQAAAQSQQQMNAQAAAFQQAEEQRAMADAAAQCMDHLRLWQEATALWAADNPEVAATRPPTLTELVGPDRYLSETPVCPSGGRYTMGLVPACSIPGHKLGQ